MIHRKQVDCWATQNWLTGQETLPVEEETIKMATNPRVSSSEADGLPDPATPTPGVRSVAQDLADYSVTLGSPEQNIACADDGNGGCLCSYDIASEPTGGGLSGRWSTQGALITHFADTQSVPSQADVCVGETTMTIWGHDRTWIWDQPGLRTITLARMPAN